MKFTPLAIATILFCNVPSFGAAHVAVPGSAQIIFTILPIVDSQIVKIKDEKEKGVAKTKIKKSKRKNAQHSSELSEPDAGSRRIQKSNDERISDSLALMRVPAPTGRDMRILLGTVTPTLLGREVVFSDIPDGRRLAYRNCPPGLAKKDPPCVPPGLAKDGITYDEWVAYDDNALEEIYLERRREYLEQGSSEVRGDLLLSSTQIASLYGLATPPIDKRYALIDGQPVLLTDEDNTSLLRINQLARAEGLPSDLKIAPTAALTQDELRQTYNLPSLSPGYNYAVLNGELVTLADRSFEMLQLLRITRSVF